MGNQTVIRIFIVLLTALCLASCGADLQTQQDELTVYESATKWVYNTPDSTCFSRVGYDSRNNVLIVVFRDSGKAITHTKNNKQGLYGSCFFGSSMYLFILDFVWRAVQRGGYSLG